MSLLMHVFFGTSLFMAAAPGSKIEYSSLKCSNEINHKEFDGKIIEKFLLIMHTHIHE